MKKNTQHLYLFLPYLPCDRFTMRINLRRKRKHKIVVCNGRMEKGSTNISLSKLSEESKRTYGLPEVNHLVPHHVTYPADGNHIKTGVSHERFERNFKGLNYRDGAGDHRGHEDTRAD